ncbi:hypothetical protein L3Y34_012787 [Caenorhabditis briggsae]|uniref:Uncharacterized protein n=1 Tax=Caenorhabditis briggsae TaxID=6238 RepID=A0AAE8ZTB3_CAEBR|nr:hypothetical protein L3Y34_012787 [Caenorhabditis briggsae]
MDQGVQDRNDGGPSGSDLYQFSPGDNHLLWSITVEKASGGPTQTTLHSRSDPDYQLRLSHNSAVKDQNAIIGENRSKDVEYERNTANVNAGE